SALRRGALLLAAALLRRRFRGNGTTRRPVGRRRGRRRGLGHVEGFDEAGLDPVGTVGHVHDLPLGGAWGVRGDEGAEGAGSHGGEGWLRRRRRCGPARRAALRPRRGRRRRTRTWPCRPSPRGAATAPPRARGPRRGGP